jgi:hypothetical protein
VGCELPLTIVLQQNMTWQKQRNFILFLFFCNIATYNKALISNLMRYLSVELFTRGKNNLKKRKLVLKNFLQGNDKGNEQTYYLIKTKIRLVVWPPSVDILVAVCPPLVAT